jgi:hypothetical protein
MDAGSGRYELVRMQGVGSGLFDDVLEPTSRDRGREVQVDDDEVGDEQVSRWRLYTIATDCNPPLIPSPEATAAQLPGVDGR